MSIAGFVKKGWKLTMSLSVSANSRNLQQLKKYTVNILYKGSVVSLNSCSL